jgi:hypothetical protein
MIRNGIAYQRVPLVPLTRGIGCLLFHGEGGLDLQTAVLLPTPCARDYRSPNRDTSFLDQLPNRIGGKLRPQFVEWMMGFSEGWTELDPSEMQSCRRSRNGSGGK